MTVMLTYFFFSGSVILASLDGEKLEVLKNDLISVKTSLQPKCWE